MNRPLRMTQAKLEAHPAWRGFGEAAGRHPPMRGCLAVPLTGRHGRDSTGSADTLARLVDGVAALETAPGLGRLVTAAAAATMAARGAERPALTTT